MWKRHRAKLARIVWLPALIGILSCSTQPQGSPGEGGPDSSGGERQPARVHKALSLKDGIFRYRIQSDPPSLDPAHSTDTTSGCILLKIYDGLVEFEPETMEVIPAVASSWEISEDALVYTFHLRQDVRFHNGRTVNAEDFRYSFQRTLAPDTVSERAWVLLPIDGAREFLSREADQVSGIRVPDEFTLELTLKEPFAPFLAQLCMEAASVVPREEVERWGDQFRAHPVGCGPFRFVEWKPDVHVVLQGFPGYYGGAPGLDKVMFRVITSATTAFEDYKAGSLDFLDQIPPGQIKRTQSAFPEEFQIWPYLSFYYLGFHHGKEPFQGNKALRQALNYAIDKGKICAAIKEDVSRPARGIIPPGVPGHNASLEGYPYDLEKAKSLLAEAGYPGGEGLPDLTLWYNNDERHKRICETVQAYLRRVGVTIRLRSLDWASYLKSCDEGTPLLFRMGWVMDYPDPDNCLYILLDSAQAGAPGNYSRFSHPRFDELVRRARVITDPAERLSLYQEAEQIAVEEACWLFMYYDREVALMKPWWDGLVLPIQGDFTIPIERLSFKEEFRPSH